MRVVITGGLGFIFSHVAEHLARKGHEVHVFDNLSAGSHPELIPSFKEQGIRVYEEDVSFAGVVQKIVALKPDWIVHAAAVSDVDASIRSATKVIIANNNATLNVFEAARQLKGLKKLLYVSTDEVYGECTHRKEEHEILFPKNPYACSKAFGSLLRLTYDNTYPELRDKTCETRFCNVFGPRQDRRKIVPAIRDALNGGAPVPLHNKGAGYREWIHVDDIPPVIELLLERGTRTYNITTEFGATVMTLLEAAEAAARRRVPTVPGKRSGMDLKYQMSGARMREEFGWTPLIEPADALYSFFSS